MVSKSEQDYQRARKYIQTHLDARNYKTLDAYVNAVSSEINTPYSQGDRDNLIALYRDGHEGYVPKQEVEYVKTELPKVAREDRLRRNEIWDHKWEARQKFARKGLRGKELQERMSAVKIPKRLLEVPTITPPTVEPQIRRVEFSKPHVITRADGTEAKYLKATYTNTRAYYFRRNGRLVSWRVKEIPRTVSEFT